MPQIRVSDAADQRIAALATLTGRPKSQVVEVLSHADLAIILTCTRTQGEAAAREGAS